MNDRIPGWVYDEGYDLDLALRSVKSGWADLVRKAFEAKPDEVKIVQVKEKWGGLRIYADYASKEYDDLINSIEAESYRVCEECGQEGSLDTTNYYLLTLCDTHKASRAGW